MPMETRGNGNLLAGSMQAPTADDVLKWSCLGSTGTSALEPQKQQRSARVFPGRGSTGATCAFACFAIWPLPAGSALE